MATNFVANGERLTATATANIASGEGVLFGSLFGVATNAVASGELVTLALTGVYDLPKAPSQAWTVGARVYWDDAEGRCTTTASSNKLIGAAVAPVGGGADDTVGRVRLNGAAVN